MQHYLFHVIKTQIKLTINSNELIKDGITGLNVAKVFKNGRNNLQSVVNSGVSGDKDISNTIFPIWSMSKTVTKVGMMIKISEVFII